MGTATVAPTGATHFSADDYLITPVRRAVQHKQDVLIAMNGVDQLLVRGQSGEYFAATGVDMAALCTAPATRLHVTVADAGALRTNQAAASKRNELSLKAMRNLDELLWMAGFYASAGRLLEGCNGFDVVQIRHWPNLSRLPHTPNTMRIVAMLTRHPTSISLAHRLLKIDPKELYQIYSAARCAGLIIVVNGSADAPEPILKPHRNQTLLSHLLAKIAGL